MEKIKKETSPTMNINSNIDTSKEILIAVLKHTKDEISRKYNTDARPALTHLMWLIQRVGLEKSGSFIFPCDAKFVHNTIVLDAIEDLKGKDIDDLCVYDGFISPFAMQVIDYVVNDFGRWVDTPEILEKIIHSLPEWEDTDGGVVDYEKVFTQAASTNTTKEDLEASLYFFNDILKVRTITGVKTY